MLLLLLLCPLFASAQQLDCTYRADFSDGGRKEVKVEVQLKDHQVVGLSVWSGIASGEEGRGYSCALETSRTSRVAKWLSSGNTMTMDTSKETGEASTVKVARLTGAFKIILSNTSNYYCGFGAEWPESVTLTKGQKKSVSIPETAEFLLCAQAHWTVHLV